MPAAAAAAEANTAACACAASAYIASRLDMEATFATLFGLVVVGGQLGCGVVTRETGLS